MVSPCKTYFFTFEYLIKSLLHKEFAAAAVCGIAGSQPGVGHHSGLADKGHQGMEGIPAPSIGIVPFCASFLFSVAGDHGAVKINRDIINTDLVKKPVLKNRGNLCITLLGKFSKNRL